MRLSILTVSLNSAKTLERTINSVVSQNDPHVEYIIIDGGSTDGTLEIIRRHHSLGHVTKYIHERDDGISDAFNKGIANSTGDIIGIINSDDYYPPGTFGKIRSHCRSAGEPFILHGNMAMERHNGITHVRPRPMPQWWKYVDSPYSHPGMFISRAAYERVGTYNTRYHYAMDCDFFLRAMRVGVPFIYLDDVLAVFSPDGASARSPRDCHRELLSSQLANGLFPPVCLATFVIKMAISYTKSFLGMYG